jgi:hypothetical protein
VRRDIRIEAHSLPRERFGRVAGDRDCGGSYGTLLTSSGGWSGVAERHPT